MGVLFDRLLLGMPKRLNSQRPQDLMGFITLCHNCMSHFSSLIKDKIRCIRSHLPRCFGTIKPGLRLFNSAKSVATLHNFVPDQIPFGRVAFELNCLAIMFKSWSKSSLRIKAISQWQNSTFISQLHSLKEVLLSFIRLLCKASKIVES